MSLADSAIDLEHTLRDRFGLERFRAGQREVIERVLGGRDVLCVMPTGGGKSLCYQLPALLLPGVTLVISPLIALMKDQVDALNQRGLRATLINSTLDPADQWARMQEIEAGRYRLVYVAPDASAAPASSPSWPESNPACSRWTRPTASASGGMISDLITPVLAWLAASSARRPASRLRPRLPMPSAATSPISSR